MQAIQKVEEKGPRWPLLRAALEQYEALCTRPPVLGIVAPDEATGRTFLSTYLESMEAPDSVERVLYTRETLLEEVFPADALLVVFSLLQYPGVHGLMETLRERFPGPVWVVLTGMEHLPLHRWEIPVRTLRQRYRYVERIFPLSTRPDPALGRSPGEQALQTFLQRELADRVRRQREHRDRVILARQREALVHRLTAYVDEMLEGYGAARRLEHLLEERLEVLKSTLLREGESRCLALLRWGRRHHEELEAMGPHHPGFLVHLDHLRSFPDWAGRRLGLMLSEVQYQLSEGHGGEVLSGQALVTLQRELPAFPMEAFSFIMAPPQPVEVVHFAPGRPVGGVQQRVEAALWEQGIQWLEKVVGALEAGIRSWVEGLCRWVRERVLERVGRWFEGWSGVPLAEVEAHLRAVEQHLEKLLGRVLRIPARHMEEGEISGITFLLRAQDRTFVEAWNRAWQHHYVRQVRVRMERMLRERVRGMRRRLLEAWDARRDGLAEFLHRKVTESLRAGAWGCTLSVAELLRHLLEEWTTELAWEPSPEGLKVDDEYPYEALLLYRKNRAFLHTRRPHVLHRHVEVMRELWRRELREVLPRLMLRLPLRLHRWFRWGVLGSGVMLGILAWTGVHPGLLLLLLAGMLLGTGGVWVGLQEGYLCPELIDEDQVIRTHRGVRKMLEEMCWKLERALLEATAHVEPQALVGTLPAEEAGLPVRSYRELVTLLAR